MSTLYFTLAEYRQIGHQLATFHAHCCKLNVLFSRAYGPGHPLELAMLEATEDEMYDFKIGLRNMAYELHPGTDWDRYFFPGGRDEFNPPNNIPACTMEETQQLLQAYEKRKLNRKHEPLTTEQLAIVVRFYSHIKQTFSAIIDRVQTDDTYLGLTLVDMSSIGPLIDSVLIELQREQHRVAHE